MLKVLISAYACAPNLGGESGLGWNVSSKLADYHEIWVITQADQRDEIKAELQNHPNPNLHFVFYDVPLLKSLVLWISKSFLFQPYINNIYYYLWQLNIYSVVKELNKREHFDLTHHVSFVRYWMPSLLALLPAPFIWGTVGGADLTPTSLKNTLPFRGRFFEDLRGVLRTLAEFDPLVAMTAKKSTIALANTPATISRLRRLGAPTIIQSFDCGFDVEDNFPRNNEQPQREPNIVRLLSVGRLIHWKGYHLSLQAFARCADLDMEYWLFGQGVERKRLEKLCRELKIFDRVRFFGLVPHEEVLKAYSASQIFIHPSMHDSGGWSVLEAMSASLPVICLNLGGPSISVSDQTGIKIPAHDPEKVIDDLASAIRKLACDPLLRNEMGQAARDRVKNNFSWDVKIKQLLSIYGNVTRSPDQPKINSALPV